MLQLPTHNLIFQLTPKKNDFKNSEIPDYIVHHGVVNTSLVVKFLQESKVSLCLSV